MKILNLRSKGNLVSLSIILGIILNTFVTFALYRNSPSAEYYACTTAREGAEKLVKNAGSGTTAPLTDYLTPCEYNYIGWPLKIPLYNQPGWSGPLSQNRFFQITFVINSVIWVFVVLIILSLLRYFKYKKNSPRTA